MDVVYNLLGVDKASDAIKRVENAFGGLERSWGKVVGALGLGGSVAYLTHLVKQSIEAADSMGDLAASVGVSVETLSSYKLAAEASGTSLEGLAKGLKKLSVNMVEAASGNDEMGRTFKALGIAVTDSNGQLRSVDDVLLDLSDAFAGTENGTSKTAAAIKTLGKEGATLIPFLNNGAAGLREFQEISRALGHTLDEETVAAADRANDMFGILGQVTGGLGNKIMREVLPTLEGLTAQLLESAKNSAVLDAAAQGVAGVFKLVVSVGAGAFNTLRAIGGALGGLMAALAQAAQGEFGQAWTTLKNIASDTGDLVIATAEQIGAVWTDSMGQVDQKTIALAKGFKGLTENTEKTKKAVDEYAKAEKAVQDLMGKSLGVSGDYVEKLRQLELWYSKNRDKTAEYVAAVEALIWAQQSSQAIVKQREDQEKALAKALEDTRAGIEKSTQAYRDETYKILEKAAALEQEADRLGMTKEAQAALTGEMRTAEIVRLQALATSDMVLLSGQDEVDNINARIAALQRLNEAEGNLAAKGAMIEAAKASRDEWSRTAGQIENALTQAMVDGFNGGKNVVKSIGEWIKNYFLTNIARSIAQSITGALTVGFSGVASAIGIGGTGGGAAGSAGGALDIAGLAGSLFGAGGLGGSVLAGAGWLTGATTFTGALGAAGSLIGTGSMGGILSGLGMGLGTLGPIAAGAYALYKLFGDNGGSPAQQAFSNIGPGDIGYGRLATNPTGANYDAVLKPVIDYVDELTRTFGGTLGSTTYGLFTSASPDGKGAQVVSNVLGSGGGNIFYSNTNDSNESMQARIAEMLPRLLLAGLQDANLPDEFEKIFGSIDLATATGAQIEKAIADATALNEERQAVADQAAVGMAQSVAQQSVVMSNQEDLLVKLNAAIERLSEIAESGLSRTAEAASRTAVAVVDAGAQITGAVYSLGPAEVNGGLTAP